MSRGPQLFICVGANHRTAALSLRETMYVAPDELLLHLARVRDQLGLAECLILSTCNRLELHAVVQADSQEQARPSLGHDLFAQMHAILHPGADLTVDEYAQHTYSYTGLEAVRHAFAVVSSLDSLVVGETQITGQFKDAFRLAEQAQTAGPLLTRLYQEALTTAKSVRNDTGIGQGTVSISSAAVEVVRLVFDKPGDHEAIVIGTGEMGRLAAEHLQRHGPKKLWIVSRSHQRATELVLQLGYGEPSTISELESLLGKTDIVISASGAPGFLISSEQLRRAQRLRQRRPMCLVDIALPRDIEPDCGQIDDVYLFDIDDLQQVVQRTMEERHAAVEMAQSILDGRTSHFAHWLSTQAIKPTMAWFNQELTAYVRREAERTLGRDMFRELTPAQRQALDTMLDAFVQRLAGTVGRNLQHPPAGFYREQLAESLRVLFSNSAST